MKCFFKENIWRNDNKKMFFLMKSFPVSPELYFVLRYDGIFSFSFG